jgi:hypothetical protein
MRKFMIVAALAVVAAGPALAGGMGDPSTVLKEKNAICNLQRRGVGPLYPNMCQPEYPPGPVDTGHDHQG